MTARTGVWALALAAVVVAHFGIRAWTGNGPVDDTFIFLRYAENLAAGDGLVFNRGERVEGFTSPLWVLALSAAAAAGLDLVALAPLLSGLLALGLALAMLRLGRPGVVAAIYLASQPWLVYWGWSGMDSALAACLVALASLAIVAALEDRRSAWLAGACIGLAAATRLETLVLLVPGTLAALAWSARHAPARALYRGAALFAPAVAILLALFVARRMYYDAWMPNTFHAKLGGLLDERIAAGTAYAAAGLLALALPLLAVTLHLALRRGRRLGAAGPWLFASGGLLGWVGFLVWSGGDHFPLGRFWVPALPLIALALARLTRERELPAIALGAVVLLQLPAVLLADRDRGRAELVRAERWAVVGRWLERAAPPDWTLATTVVGAIPYYSRLRTLDLLGLTDRSIATGGRLRPGAAVGHQRYDTDYAVGRAPEIVVFPSSGRVFKPRRTVDERFAFALLDFTRHPAVRSDYVYRTSELADGSYVEWLQRRDAIDRPPD